MAEQTPWQRAKRWATNGVIALALALMLAQAWPGVPPWLSWRPMAVADAIGLSQGQWSMFTPEPDYENHRLRAVIEYHDGQRVEWQSPNWSEQSSWQRFTGHRESEYYDAIRTPFFAPALPGLAAWLAKTQRPDSSTAPVKRIEIHAQYYDIGDPRIHGWNVRPTVPVYDQEVELFAEEHPLAEPAPAGDAP